MSACIAYCTGNRTAFRPIERNHFFTATIAIDFTQPFYTAGAYSLFYEFYKKLFTYLKEQFVFRKK